MAWSPEAWILALSPLLAVALAALGVWWDLARRRFGVAQASPDEAQLERFELRKLNQLAADVEALGIRMSSIAELVQEQLEEAIDERRTASAMKARASKVLKDQREAPLEAPEPPQEAGSPGDLDGVSREEQIERVRARYEAH